jgi:predicted RNA binding protein YcfA (HicA-like mRNA interferase family)
MVPNAAVKLTSYSIYSNIIFYRYIQMKFSELIHLLERNGFKIFKEKGSIRYYTKQGLDRLIRVDYHGSREIPSGTCDAIIKAAGLKKKGK